MPRAPRGLGGLRRGLARLEEGQEGRVLGQIGLDLRDACPDPVLEPGLGQVVRDAVEAPLAHGENDRQRLGRLPWADRLNFGDRGTYLVCAT
jgi:hypothetical protein